MITKETYQSDLHDYLERVNSRLQSYLEKQSEDNVHDLRTAIRRVETRAELLPKRLRKEELGDYLSLSKKLMKSTSSIRDLDIIKEKLAKVHLSVYDTLIKEIGDERKEHIPKSKKLSRKLERLEPKVNSDNIKERKLHKRFQKLVDELDKEITSLLPVVLKGPERIKELHSLRMNCKKLRYILEISHSDPKRVKALISWQDSLGKVHDCDIALQYLSEIKSTPAVTRIISEIKKTRSVQYSEFVSLFKGRETATPSDQAAQRAINLTGMRQT
jgi:CHAD domain-containing protein